MNCNDTLENAMSPRRIPIARTCDIAKELSKKMITIDFKCIDC